uniref:Uncharacterized protein n=2 Tax=Clastoptera arizonana TaxID=38151 RepID=A0A1B6CSP2_9HEMI
MNLNSIHNGTIEEWPNKVMDHKPIVTYAGDKDLFQSLEPTLVTSLPQEAAEWRRSYGRAIKSIYLAATFVPFNKDILPKEGDYQLIHQPIFHTYWTQCPDVDTYKTSARESMEGWMKILTHNNINDWMIVLVETYDFRKTNKLIPRTTVLDKIRSDFGAKNADRCLSVINPLKSESRSAGSWRGLLVNMRLLLLTAYDRTLLRFEETIRDHREKRNHQGWSFCSYFLLQEQLAFVLEMLGVYDEALVQYDELDALFTQFVLNSNVGDTPDWLCSFQVSLESWPGLLLTNSINIELRRQIKDNTISLLQFRSYLFSRQCTMLLLSCKPWEVAQRCLPFLHNCINELKILEISSPPGAVACWIFLCCLEVLHTCEKFHDSSQVEAFSLYTAGLWAYARDKLGELGELCGLMPENETTSEQLHTVVILSAGIGDAQASTAVENLKQSLSSKEAFKKQYLELSELAMGTYKHINRHRCAHQIGRELSVFYRRVGDLSTAAGFLLNALKSYEDDGWQKLAAQTRIDLASCYKDMADDERYAKMCASIASSETLDIPLRVHYFLEMQRILQDINPDPPWTNTLSNCFNLMEAEIKFLEKESCVEATLEIECHLPSSLMCVGVQASIEQIKKEIRNVKKPGKVETDNDKYPRNMSESLNPLNSMLMRLHIIESLDYQEDRSLAGSNVACPNMKKILRRQDSQNKSKKPSVATRGDYTNCLSSGHVILQPGKNRVVLKSKTEEQGYFRLNQLSIEIEGLNFLCSLTSFRLVYEVTATPIVVTITNEEKGLVAGLPQNLMLNIFIGSQTIPPKSSLKLHTSVGLTIKCKNVDQPLCRDLDIALPEEPVSPFSTIEIPLTVFAQLQPQRDSNIIEHNVNLRCPWTPEEKPLPLHFQPPFLSVYRLQTASIQKFVHISVVGLNSQSLLLTQPQLNILLPCSSVELVSLNPASGQKLTVSAERRLGFMWELKPDDSANNPPIHTEFSISYSPVGNESQFYVYRCPFDITNYKTIFVVESRIEPTKGSEFCRASTMCHLHLSVQRVCASPDSSLMYEVLADQTMWAVCGKTAGVITLDTGERQSVLLDVMPLINGYLPLPLVRLSKYIPADLRLTSGRITHTDSHPRLEPFSPGQVYNSSKGTQVHVIAAANT